MSLEEFVRDKTQKLDDSHTILFLKREQMKKDIATIEEQILMAEGAVTFINKFLSEWSLYDSDTQKIKALEDASKKKNQIPDYRGKKKTITPKEDINCQKQQLDRNK